MSLTREELIADWRERLSTAEATSAASPQFAWLVRVRIRLFRFLLACYGESDWTTAPPKLPNEPICDSRSSVIFDSADALPLGGKPAKSAGKIQAVLKAVSNANEPHEPGPMAKGLGAESWVVATSGLSKVRLTRLTRFLRRKGITSRLRRAGGDYFLEVLHYERSQARECLEDFFGSEKSAQARMRSRSDARAWNKIPRNSIQEWVFFGFVVLPTAAMVAAMLEAAAIAYRHGADSVAFSIGIFAILVAASATLAAPNGLRVLARKRTPGTPSDGPDNR